MITPGERPGAPLPADDAAAARFPALSPHWGDDTLDPDTLAVMARALTASGRYRVVERFERRPSYHVLEPGAVVRRALFVDVEEVYFHCPKAFRRGRTWEPSTWKPTAARPFVDIALALWRKGQPEDEVRRHFAESVEVEPLYPPTPRTSPDEVDARQEPPAAIDSTGPDDTAPSSPPGHCP